MLIDRLSNLLSRYNPARLAPAVLINEWARRLPEKGIASKELMICDGRHRLHEVISLGGFPVIGEIGVFKGDFAQFLKSRYRPSPAMLMETIASRVAASFYLKMRCECSDRTLRSCFMKATVK